MLKVYSIYDSKAEGFSAPWYAPTRGLAIRMIITSLDEPNSNYVRFSADYTLFELGEFDQHTGQFVEKRENLGQITQYLPARQQADVRQLTIADSEDN